LAQHGKPKIFDTDQGSQFIKAAFKAIHLSEPKRRSD